MYRNVYYKCNKSTNWHGEIWFSTWDEHGNPIEMSVPHKSHLCYESKNKTTGNSNIYEYKTLYGKSLEIQHFNSTYKRSEWMKEHPNCNICECLSPEKEFLLKNFEGQQEQPDFNRFPFRTQYIDIECPAEFEFPHADLANYPVVLITVYDTFLKEFHVWSIKDFEIPVEYNNIVKHIFQSDSDKNLLRDWLMWQKKNTPDVISGWNVESFDIPYLVNRCFKLFNNEDDRLEDSFVAKMWSPVQNIKKVIKEIKNRGEVITYQICGISLLDYYSMYRYKFSLASRASWKLGDVCEDEIKTTKLSYAGTIWDFCKYDYNNFAKYNIIDVELCVKLDEKLKFIENARQICNFGLVEYENIFKSQPYIYGMLLLEARQDGITLPSLNYYAEDISVKDDQFEGAYVFEPQTGFYNKGVFSIDFNSLYPNIMISLNISPETKLAKIKSQNDTHVELIMHPSNEVKVLSIADFKKLKSKTILSANNVIYCKHETKHGILAKYCSRMYNSRVETKNRMKQLYKNNDQQSKFEYDRLDIIQYAYKIIMNSIYGIMGNKYFSMFDIDNAVAITSTGQVLIRDSATYVNTYFKDRFNVDYDVVLAGDTDSLYINARPYVENLGVIPKEQSEIKKMCVGLDEIVDKINENCKGILQNTFNTEVATIQFKRETFCASGCFVAKKRYVLHVIDDEGKPVDKFKYVGVDIKKNELPKDIKSMLRLIVEGGMKNNWDNKQFQKIMLHIREKYLQFPPEKIAFQKNYGTEKNPDGFLCAEKGAGLHAKAVIFHNQLIDKLNIKNKEEEIFVDDRFRYVQVKAIGGYPIKVLAFKTIWPEEFSKYFAIDYDTMFEKTMCKPLEQFIKAFGWKKFMFIDTVGGNLMDL